MRRHEWRSLAIAGLLALHCAGPVAPQVRPGIDVLLADSLHLVRGRRVGIVTNQTGIDHAGRDDLSRLLGAGVRVTAIFSPEHGFRGTADVENIGHGVDSATGLPVYSLYGPTRAPSPEMLAQVDVLLVDLQDIGTRTYTYVSTALLALRAATAAGVATVVLDRPNPLGGIQVQGPVLDTALASFIGMLAVPLRHGMTLGELVRLGNQSLAIRGPLTVVPVAGWRRDVWFDATALPWVRPSPNMPDLESATHYPGIVIFEATNLSVGRGTPVAFQVVGAPWLDAAGVAGDLATVPGVAVTDTLVTPTDPTDAKYGGVTVPAVRFRVTDRGAYDPVALAVRLFAAIQTRHPTALEVDTLGLDRRLGSASLRRALRRGLPLDSLLASWEPDLERFHALRAGHLLYH